MSDLWLSGRAVGISDPWPSAELGAEERRALYGGVPTELPPERVTVLDEVSGRVLEALAAGPLSARELALRTGSTSTAYRAVTLLARRGLIERIGGRQHGDGRGKVRICGGRWALATRLSPDSQSNEAKTARPPSGPTGEGRRVDSGVR